MSKYIIEGPVNLKGKVAPSGAKNASLKQIASAILTSETVSLHNVPKIIDVFNMLEIIKKLGAKVKWSGANSLTINCADIHSCDIDPELSGKLRASIVLVGPLLARLGKATLTSTGGDAIGKRPIDAHLKGFEKLGVKIKFDGKKYIFDALRAHNAQFFLDELSVTATENLMFLATTLAGKTILRGVAQEPEIEDLALMLGKMGAKITGAGTPYINIEGVEKLEGCDHTTIPDRIEIGTLACATIVTGGTVTITDVILEHIENFLNQFEKMGVNYKFKSQISPEHGIPQGRENLKTCPERSRGMTMHNSKSKNRTWGDLEIYPSENLKPIYIDTRPYPGFPTDLQAQFALLLTQANGESRIFETQYEGRLDYSQQLNKLKAKIEKRDEHNILISGPTKLQGAEIATTDIRAGATLALAGLIASGKTIVDNTEILERGYENFDKKLRSLGAKIKKSE